MKNKTALQTLIVTKVDNSPDNFDRIYFDINPTGYRLIDELGYATLDKDFLQVGDSVILKGNRVIKIND